MHYKFLELSRPLTYEGHQLSPHWIYRQHDLLGDAVVAWIGPCEVKITEMVDLEDVKSISPIYSPRMVHFIAEFFDLDLEKAVYRQRLLITTAKEYLEENFGLPVIRKGDDLFLSRPGDKKPGKLSVSIATSSAISTLIHTGFNVLTEGTPVVTAGLAEFSVEPEAFGRAVLKRFAEEVEDIWLARCKVRPV